MKYIFTIFLLLALPFCNSGCSDDDDTQESVDQLPPLTTSGENTFGCLVNGEVFAVTNTSKQVAIFQQGQLQFGASIDVAAIDQSINLNLIDPLEINEKYFFDNLNYYAGYTLRTASSTCIYLLEDTYLGQITFSNIDRTNFIISGTFDFSTVTQECDTVQITDGRFDLQYIP